MKLFHISDLHLGKRIYEFPMLEEQRELLLKILRSIDEEQPQALLISGDIYDKPVPPTEAVRLLDDFLTEVSKRGLHTYLIAGNHDSAQRLEFGKEIFGRESIHISGSIGEGLAHVTETDEYGTVEIWLLPFFKPAHVNALLREEEVSSYAAAAKLLLEREEIDFSKRNVILVHQFVTWRGAAERSDSETLSLGGVDEIDAGLFFDFDYVALGHLHNPQRLGRETVRYAGSPMPYSFSEIRRKKGITVVELKEKGVVSLDFIPLETKRQFREIKGPLEEILAAGRETGGSEDYIRCILTNSWNLNSRQLRFPMRCFWIQRLPARRNCLRAFLKGRTKRNWMKRRKSYWSASGRERRRRHETIRIDDFRHWPLCGANGDFL